MEVDAQDEGTQNLLSMKKETEKQEHNGFKRPGGNGHRIATITL